MQIGERALVDEAQCRRVIQFGFAGKAGEDVGAQGRMRQGFVDQFDAAGVVFGAIPAMHGREHTIGGRLQGHMEVRGDSCAGSEQIDQVSGDIERLDGTDTQPLNFRLLEDLPEQVEEFDARGEVAPVAAQVDATQNNFAEAAFGQVADFAKVASNRLAAGFAADERNDAERAAGVAAVLNL